MRRLKKMMNPEEFRHMNNKVYTCLKCSSIFEINEESNIHICNSCGSKKLRQISFKYSKERKERCFEILKNENLLDLFDEEFNKKIVKEHDARKVIFLIQNMRNVENIGKGTDNLIVNAVSGTGKDHITEAIFEILPTEEKEELVKTTPKVLSYTRNRNVEPEATWKKTALRLEDVTNAVVNDEIFKVFLSANPNKVNYGKTVNRGKVIDIAIEGKPSIILTIANATVGDEQLRRLPNIFLDEGINQTQEILKRQAKFAVEGKSIDYDPYFTYSLRLLKRVNVKIPYAEKLVQIFQNSIQNVIVRTAFQRFLDYIKSSASFHQFNREVDSTGSVIANEQDYKYGVLCLKKTTSNIYMIPLSRLDETIYNLFKEKNLEDISFDEIYNLPEIQHLGKGDRWIRFRLDFLVSKNFLTRKTEHIQGSFKPINKYSYNKLEEFKIPTFTELTMLNSNSNTSINTNTSINSFTSNTNKNDVKKKKEGVFEVFEVNETELHNTQNCNFSFKELRKAGYSPKVCVELIKIQNEVKNEKS